ncbi:deoxyribodipyrimidine photo-lyase [Marinobacter gelidimuriae]|uniref:deoxyribodipyrimidine photo-lyase n=1 Tax=Marinobacter gelidimuriae TaxID=2739064 RepID=UPI000362884C
MRTLYWFTRDLRLHDNAALLAASKSDMLLCVYVVASNYGNWQYLAGVGADPRGLRRLNLDKQAQQYDPNGTFIDRWNGHAEQPVGLHTVDAADWPLP